MFVPNFVSLSHPQSPNTGQNSDGGISDFWVSGQLFMNKKNHNSRASLNIDTKLQPVIKLT